MAVAATGFESEGTTRTRDDDHRPTLTVIIPVFNEAATLEECVRQVLRAPVDKQVLIVDDGSTDATPALLENLEATRPVHVLRHLDNRGKGAAVRTALPHAVGRFTVIQDGDLELSPAEYPRLLAPLISEQADCVIGSRYLESPARSLSRVGVSFLNLNVQLLYGVRLTDEACCYKVFPTDVLRRMNLESERFELCPEAVAKACRLGLRIREVPVSYRPRRPAEGKKLRYRDGVDALKTLWRWRRWSPDGAAFPSAGPEEVEDDVADVVSSPRPPSGEPQVAGAEARP